MLRAIGCAALMLLAALLPMAVGQQTPDKDYQAVADSYDAAMKQYSKEVTALMNTEEGKKARESGDRAQMDALRAKIPRPDVKPFIEKMNGLVKARDGKDSAVKPLTWLVLRSNNKDAATVALETLTKSYARSAELGDLLEAAPMLERATSKDHAKGFIDGVATNNKHNLMRAHALYTQANAKMGKDASASDKEEGAKLMKEAEVLAKGSDLELKIQAPAFAAANLKEGKLVPNIEGEDLDGVKFTLHDYKGKVVLLDFWGDW